MANPRVRKVADRIQVIVAEMLERRIKDPRLGFVTVTDVRMTGDNQNATIYWTVLDEESARDTAAALESAKGVLRSEVGKQLGMRTVPTLAFQRDALPETARALEELLARAREADAAVAAAREGKAPAGEADPYRKPRVVEDDDDLADLDDPDDAQDVGLADDRRPGEA